MYSLKSYVSVVILIVLQRQNEIQLVLVLRKLLRAGNAVFKYLVVQALGAWSTLGLNLIPCMYVTSCSLEKDIC